MSALVEVEGLTKSFGARHRTLELDSPSATRWRSLIRRERRGTRAPAGAGDTDDALQAHVVRAVDQVSFSLGEGETLALVGESGSGKSTTLLLLACLLKPDHGRILLDGQDYSRMASNRLGPLRRQMQVVFQDPFASLDPRMRVATAIAEPLVVHRVGTAASRRARAEELLDLVGLDAGFGDRHPSELSGGQAQRICIARALALEPRILLLDEPTSALDVSVQAQIVTLLRDLQREFKLTFLFVSHNLAVVASLADHVAVMQSGRIVEQGPVSTVYAAPAHPYTRALLGAVLDPWATPNLEAEHPDNPWAGA